MVRANLRRGFWRVTSVLSALLFLAGGTVVGIAWWDRHTTWQRAIEQPTGEDQIVVLVPPIGSIAFPRTHNLDEIRSAIDQAQALPDTGLVMKSHECLRASDRKPSEKDRIVAVSESSKTPCQAVKPDYGRSRVAYVYLFLPTPKRSALLSLREFLEYERQHKESLTAEESASITEARSRLRLPYPAERPTVLDAAQWLALVAGVAAVPWILYYMARWILQGFSNSQSTP